jgi:ABC-2 type transport system ATP-binding protein
LTTHYIEEAERLCDRVAIIDQGQIIEMGTPRAIQQRTLGNSRIEIECQQPIPADALPPFLAAADHSFSEDRKSLTVDSEQPARTIVELVKWIDQLGIGLADIHLKRPTLEDVFIKLTGKRLRD